MAVAGRWAQEGREHGSVSGLARWGNGPEVLRRCRNGVVLKKGRVVGKDGVSRVTATLAPGRYTYLCTVGKHAKNGMTGTLTVTR